MFERTLTLQNHIAINLIGYKLGIPDSYQLHEMGELIR